MIDGSGESELEPHLLHRRDHYNALEKSVQLVNGFDCPYVARCPMRESAELRRQKTQQRLSLSFEQTGLSSLLPSSTDVLKRAAEPERHWSAV